MQALSDLHYFNQFAVKSAYAWEVNDETQRFHKLEHMCSYFQLVSKEV